MNGAAGAPRIISWNITLRCPLKCAHCYVDAGEEEADGVLSTQEAFYVINQICETGKPVVVLSGGEPLLRKDIFAVARYGTEQGLRMVMGTSGYLIDQETAIKLKDAGIKAVAISLDSKDPTVHDSFRGLEGVWERAVQAIGYCRDAGIAVQINMSVMRSAISEVEDLIGLGTSLGVRDYQLFFPIPTGRARQIEPRSAAEYEDLIRQILIRYRNSDLNIRPTCAPQFRRIADSLGITNPVWGRGCLAGITYCRIFANGDVTPCPYLPVSAGNVRATPFTEIWNNSPLFAALRDPDRLTGKCGRCSFKTTCGGCRARAYRREDAASLLWCDGLATPEALEGEICGEDPWCPYQPGKVTP
ncbi:MAG: radical SAM protein [Methanoregulaceae archaeon]|nr:MAG: radical SAM protein [Methanoregulaceae archaeon]